VHLRFDDHKRAIRSDIDLQTAKDDKKYSKLAFHSKSNGHNINWTEASIIHFEKFLSKRIVSESMAMAAQGSDSILSQPSHELDKIWNPLLRAEAPRFFKEKCIIPDVNRQARQKPNQTRTNNKENIPPAPDPLRNRRKAQVAR